VKRAEPWLGPLHVFGENPPGHTTIDKLSKKDRIAVYFLFYFGFFGNAMTLTRRQTTFIERLVDLYHESQGPIHYSTLAQRLGVSRFTAYDMLRLLEAKGLVTSVYQVSAGHSGPGRAEVLYQPTDLARALVADLAGPAGPAAPGAWETVRQRLLENFTGNTAQDPGLTQALLAHVPPAGPAPVRYCLEVMTVVALRVRGRQRDQLAAWLPALLRPPEGGDPASLSLLGGWALNTLAAETETDEAWRREALAHLRRYQALVIAMDPAACRALSAALDEMFTPLLTGPLAPARESTGGSTPATLERS
jgi:DNA-binding PadR family transcriptional regulator